MAHSGDDGGTYRIAGEDVIDRHRTVERTAATGQRGIALINVRDRVGQVIGPTLDGTGRSVGDAEGARNSHYNVGRTSRNGWGGRVILKGIGDGHVAREDVAGGDAHGVALTDGHVGGTSRAGASCRERQAEGHDQADHQPGRGYLEPAAEMG